MHHCHGNGAGLGSLPVWQAGVNQQPSCSNGPTRVFSKTISQFTATGAMGMPMVPDVSTNSNNRASIDQSIDQSIDRSIDRS